MANPTSAGSANYGWPGRGPTRMRSSSPSALRGTGSAGIPSLTESSCFFAERADRLDRTVAAAATTPRWSRSSHCCSATSSTGGVAWHPRRTVLRSDRLDRAHLQPPPPTARPRQAHPRRVRTRLHLRPVPRRRRSSVISHNRRQPNLQQTRLSPGASTQGGAGARLRRAHQTSFRSTRVPMLFANDFHVGLTTSLYDSQIPSWQK